MTEWARCYSCDTKFPTGNTDENCPECGSTLWVPWDPDYEPEHDDEDSASKIVVEWEFKTHERPDPQPNRQALHITTEDGWEYVFHEPNPNEGYELYTKYRDDNTESDDDVVPVSVAEYIDEMSVAALNYAKLVVHPSTDTYTPPQNA